jgi:hypothetical protein
MSSTPCHEELAGGEVPVKCEVPVKITLQGLMFTRYVPRGDYWPPFYEVGILPAKCHDFAICYTINSVDNLQLTGSEVAPPTEGCFVLEIYRPYESGYRVLPPDAELFINCDMPEFDRAGLSMCKDLPGKIAADYRWVSDLEGDEFHTHELPLISKKVHPIIKFPNGKVQTQRLTQPLLRTQEGTPKPKPFGKMADSVEINICAKPGDILVLRERFVQSAILRITLAEKTRVTINITNIPPPEPAMDHSTSHFTTYYGAISDSTLQRFDFKPIPQPATHSVDESVLNDTAERPRDVPEVCTGASGGGGAPLCGGVFMSKHKTEF